MNRKKKPNITKNDVVITPLPTLKRRSLKYDSGSIGCASDPLPAHERNAEHGGGDEGDDDDRIGPAAFRPLDDPEEQRAEADE